MPRALASTRTVRVSYLAVEGLPAYNPLASWTSLATNSPRMGRFGVLDEMAHSSAVYDALGATGGW